MSKVKVYVKSFLEVSFSLYSVSVLLVVLIRDKNGKFQQQTNLWHEHSDIISYSITRGKNGKFQQKRNFECCEVIEIIPQVGWFGRVNYYVGDVNFT